MIGSCKGKGSSRRLGGDVAAVALRGREIEGVLVFLISCENELDELSSGLKEPWLNCRGTDWRREVGVGMEVDIRFTAGETEGGEVVLGERVVPLGFRVVPLVLLSLLSMETLDNPLVFVLTEGDVMDTREVEVLRDTLVDASDGAPFFVFAMTR